MEKEKEKLISVEKKQINISGEGKICCQINSCETQVEKEKEKLFELNQISVPFSAFQLFELSQMFDEFQLH